MAAYHDDVDVADPEAYFACDHLRATIMRGTCASRQQAKWDKGGPVHPHCANGKCEQGRLVKLGLGGYSPPKFRELRSDWRAQKKAKFAKMRIEAMGN